MPTGQPKLGYRKTKQYASKTTAEIEKELSFRVPDILRKLEELTKPITCPGCGTSIPIIDKEVGMYLVDRVLGKSKQKVEMDVTQTVQLNADQLHDVLHNHLPEIVDMFKVEIMQILESDIKLLTQSPLYRCATSIKGNDIN